MSQLLLTTLGVVCPNCDEFSSPGTAKCGNCGADPYGATPAAKTLPGATASLAGRPATASRPSPPAIPPLVAPRVPTAPQGIATATPVPGGTPVPHAISTATTPVAPLPAIPALARASGPKDQPPGLSSRPGVRVMDVVPPGMRPTLRPGSTPAAHEAPQPIPASDLVRKPPTVPPASSQPSKFSLAALAGAQRGQRVRLSQSCQIGRSRGQILFQDDPYISALHCSLTVRDGRLYVRDESSASGTFVSVPGQEQIQQNVHFSAGGRLFRFMGLLNAPQTARSGAAIIYGAPLPPGHVVYGVEEILVGSRGGRAVVTGGALLTIGTSKCDLSFPADEGMATRHCELSPTPSGALLRDLSGGLGTFIRLQGTERALTPGDKIRIGNQILQVEA
ncbi:MAG TPA: FHA domain-containing protein [Myxococcales bacterium]|nr:FHA domain-containing protein [Myxococcales bacterium]